MDTVKKLNDVISELERKTQKGCDTPDLSFVQPVAIARLYLKDRLDDEDIEKSFNSWLNNYEEMLRHVSQPYSFREYYKLTADERMLYYSPMVDLSENDLVRRSVLFSEAAKIFDRIKLENLLSELHKKGFMIITQDSDYMLVR